jgi:hypothetical protein
MIKVIAGFGIMILLSCSNKSKTSPTNEGAPNTPNVENVNGNMPDTSSSVNLANPPKTQDSSRLKDSTKK